MAAGHPTHLVAETLEINRSTLYYRPQPRSSRADRRHDERIVEVCGDQPALGYRRVQWVAEGCGRLAGDARARPAPPLPAVSSHAQKGLEQLTPSHPNLVWQSDMTKLWAGPTVGWAYLVSVLDRCTREIIGWDLSLRCRSQDAPAALNQAVLQVLPFDPHGKELTLTLTTDNGTQFTSTRYPETLRQLGITRRRTAYNHPEGNGRIERFHRSLKEEEVWLHEYPVARRSPRVHRPLDPPVQPSAAPSSSQLPDGALHCGIGQCGACTVIVNREAVLSCVTPLASAEEKTIATPLSSLEASSLIVRESHPSGGRTMPAKLTTQGIAILRVGWKAVQTVEERMLRCLSPKEQIRLGELLEHCLTALRPKD